MGYTVVLWIFLMIHCKEGNLLQENEKESLKIIKYSEMNDDVEQVTVND